MSLQPNHLIERAAALLKASSVPRSHNASAQSPKALPPTGAVSLGATEPGLIGASAAPEALALAPAIIPVPQSPALASPSLLPDVDGGDFHPGAAIPTAPPAFTPLAVQAATQLAASRPAPAPVVASLPATPLANVSRSQARVDAGSLLPTITIEALERAGMVVARAARTRISEEYRIVIGRVLRALRDDNDGAGAPNLLMVTSARPGEGKSFTALNLAGSIAQHGTEKVLLVDVDAKLRPISALLEVGDRLGFHDLVADPTLRPEDVILNTAIGNLTFLPVGSRSGEASDTASVRPITPLLTRLSRSFPKHLILLDAPPCLSTSDPHTIAPFVRQVVMVIEAERTQRSEVEAALDLVRVCPTITILLNKVTLTTSHTFGAYDYYGSYT